MNEVKSGVEKLVQKELNFEEQTFLPFCSNHEGAAFIFANIERTERELSNMRGYFKELWESVKQNADVNWHASLVRIVASNLACEAIQVAAMAQKFINSQKEREKSEDNRPERM